MVRDVPDQRITATTARILEEMLEDRLVLAVIFGPVIEQSLDVVVEEDHLRAAVFVCRLGKLVDQRIGRFAIEVVGSRRDEVLRKARGFRLVDEADVDIATRLVGAVLRDLTAGLLRDVADCKQVCFGELLAQIGDRVVDELHGGLGAKRAIRATDHVAIALFELGRIVELALPRLAEALAFDRTADHVGGTNPRPKRLLEARTRGALGLLFRGVVSLAFGFRLCAGLCGDRDGKNERARNDRKRAHETPDQ